jgi:hypothetical protein
MINDTHSLVPALLATDKNLRTSLQSIKFFVTDAEAM